MVATATEYETAQAELRDLTARLDRLQQAGPPGTKGFAKAGIRKLIARLHEELAEYGLPCRAAPPPPHPTGRE